MRQNTSNFKVNAGLAHGLELDFDVPYISIYRASGTQGSSGIGDADIGIKWQFHHASPDSRLPSLAATFYVEFPTGDVGIRTTRGQVYTGGLSLLHDFTAKWTMGGEVYVGVADNNQLGRTQLQGMAGGQYNVRSGLTLTFGAIVGKYAASPHIGGQVGFAMDFPDVWRRKP